MLDKNKQLIGTILSTPSTEVAEIVANSGLDWVFIDHEHSTLSEKGIQRIIQAVEGKIKTAVRIAENSETYIKKILDTGCDAIIVPQINCVKDAKKLVKASKYPPLGLRSIGFGRAQKYGLDLKGYIETANKNISIIAQIEHIDAVQNIEEITSLEGIDGIFIGPYDLSNSMGLTGEVSHPKVQKTISQIKQHAKKNKIPWGIFCGSMEQAKKEKEDGANFIVISSDLLLIAEKAKEISEEL